MFRLNGCRNPQTMLFPLLLMVVTVVAASSLTITAALEAKPRSNVVFDTASPPVNRIVGGTSASANLFPYQVALFRQGTFFCGGSLITAKWVLTAAHCVTSGYQVVHPSLMVVLAGTVYLNSGGVLRTVRRIIPHERYGNHQNDIAVMELLQAYQLGSSISTIALRRTEVPTGSNVIIIGWGRLYTGGPISNVLQYNWATTIPKLACAREYGIVVGLLCLSTSANNGACNGDSGGPAVYNNQLVGVSSFGSTKGCGSFSPDVYALVSDYVQWIESRIN
uniref:Putative serine-type enodpeptidase n=1 Tax=Aedes albopictus TaxID=7160 RepID=A0A023EPH8_AEDAL